MKIMTNRGTVIKAVLLLAAIVVFAAGCLKQAERLAVPITSAEVPESLAVRVSDKAFDKFSHKTEEHKQFECASCHRREGKRLDLDFAGHDSCVGCHLNQFTDIELLDDKKIMCTICHSSTDVTAADPKMRPFPVKFAEGFNMKFDHGDHDSGEGRPPEGCASCHKSAGAGKSIPIGIQAHANCYACHTAESKIGSCNTCHALAPYKRTSPSAYNFRYIFRHDDHSPRQGVSCNECHNVSPGAPQGRQVSNISIRQHLTPAGSNCAQCHNGRRAFSGNNTSDMNSCTRCHLDRVNVLPAGSLPDPKIAEEP